MNKYMKKIIIIIFVAIFIIFFVKFATNYKNENKNLVKVSFLLDWVPNTNHTGIYVALEKGYFEDVGIDLKILNPPEESTTALVAGGKADFGVSFQDTLITAMSENEKFPVVAVGTIIQHNTSGILSLKERGIDSFKKLEGKTYATWDSEMEKAMISQVMRNEGGDFANVKLYHSVVTDAITAIQSNVDAVWAFEAWDVMKVRMENIDYNFLKFRDIEKNLDFYTPVIIANEKYLKENEEIAKKFLQATKKGYEYAIKNPEESAKILHKIAPEYDINMLIESQKYLSKEYKADVERWGYIDKNRWNNFCEWAYDKQIVDKKLSNIGFTNDYLPR